MDTLVLKGLKYRGLHGYYEQERVDGNDFEIDLVFQFNMQQSAGSDDLSHTLDYQQVQEIVDSVMNGPSIKLIERIAFLIGEEIFNSFNGLQGVTVKLRKMNPPISRPAECAEVTMSWPR